MTKKLLHQIVDFSYNSNILDEKKVLKIADLLSRKDLKIYIRYIIAKEKEISVLISSPVNLKRYKKDFEKIFTNKNLMFEEDKSLLAGVKITANDMVYELSLRNNLEKLEEYINE